MQSDNLALLVADMSYTCGNFNFSGPRRYFNLRFLILGIFMLLTSPKASPVLVTSVAGYGS